MVKVNISQLQSSVLANICQALLEQEPEALIAKKCVSSILYSQIIIEVLLCRWLLVKNSLSKSN